MPHIFGNKTHIFGTLRHIFGTMPHIFGTIPHLFGTIPHLFGTMPQIFGTMPHIFGTMCADFWHHAMSSSSCFFLFNQISSKLFQFLAISCHLLLFFFFFYLKINILVTLFIHVLHIFLLNKIKEYITFGFEGVSPEAQTSGGTTFRPSNILINFNKLTN